nr:D-amino acid dehydrogenase [uncultured Brevundimonas sp.]
MRVLVLGSGVIGVTTAWQLSQAGHEVVVVDRETGPALQTSFANAGQVSPGYSAPWAAPSIPVKAMKWLLMRHAPLIIRPKLDMAMIRWTLAMLRNCTHERYALNKGRMVRLAEYSRDQLDLLRRQTGIAYDGREQGTLQLFRTEKQLADVHKDVDVLRAQGVPCEVLDPAACIAAEPGLAASAVPFVGGLRLPNDETGDCFLFTNALAKLAAERGVIFHNGVQIHGLTETNGCVDGARTSIGALQADAVVVALGSYSPQMVAPLGLKLPVYPVKGYSITARIIDAARAPVSTVMDESYKVAITRLGDRIRVGGMAELSGYNNSLPHLRRETLEQSVGSLFPGGGDLEGASYWSGLRPMTPDGTPVIGATPVPGLYLNTGHGTLGWTMACGSARVLADLIDGKTPEIEAQDLSLNRYGSWAGAFAPGFG